MPNTDPVNDNAGITRAILEKARAEGLVRVYPIGAITRGQKGEELAEYGDLREAGCVAVSDDGRPVASARVMRRAGIANDTTVVFYGDKNNWWAAYALWVFKLFGHPRCLIMDGGRMKWEAEKRAMSKAAPLY